MLKCYIVVPRKSSAQRLTQIQDAYGYIVMYLKGMCTNVRHTPTVNKLLLRFSVFSSLILHRQNPSPQETTIHWYIYNKNKFYDVFSAALFSSRRKRYV